MSITGGLRNQSRSNRNYRGSDTNSQTLQHNVKRVEILIDWKKDLSKAPWENRRSEFFLVWYFLFRENNVAAGDFNVLEKFLKS